MRPEEVFALLAADAGVAALVADRIFPDVASEETSAAARESGLAYVVFWEVGGRAWQTISDGIGLRQWRIRFGCWARTAIVAKQIRTAIETAICDANLGTHVYMDADFDEVTGLHRAIVDISIGE